MTYLELLKRYPNRQDMYLAITQKYRLGVSLTELSIEFDLSKQRIEQILAQAHRRDGY